MRLLALILSAEILARLEGIAVGIWYIDVRCFENGVPARTTYSLDPDVLRDTPKLLNSLPINS